MCYNARMGFYINKIVGACADPLMVGVLLALAGILLLARGWRRSGLVVGLAGVGWLWVVGCGAFSEAVGCHLEREFPPAAVETLPQADAIVVLGGGMCACRAVSPYAEMFAAADRAWHAARLYKAGRAPLVIPTGTGEESSTVPLLLDLGVPRTAIRVEDQARNTEENARFVERLLAGAGRAEGAPRPRVLLVTSAWHMRRSLLMYRRYAPGLDIVPAAADYDATMCHAMPAAGNMPKIFPDASSLAQTKVMFKELVGYWGYRILRR